MYCPICHEETFADATVCRFCGAILPGLGASPTRASLAHVCSTCSQLVPIDAAYCPACGASVRGVVTGPTTRLAPLQVSTRSDTQPLIRICPKCHGAMEPGFLPIFPNRSRDTLVWVPGTVNRNPWNGAIMVDLQIARVIQGYSCAMCGYLELYALDVEL